ncbi:MAG TPA: bifunctional aldolase/short-chain dehydrogenase [Micromonosporaceae bacterium]
MQQRWNDADAAGLTTPLALCAYGSRLLGSEPGLVLHGGGNTSVKDTVIDVTGAPVEVLWVKGSGWDLATIEPAGFAPLRLHRLRELLDVPSLSDPQMMNELRCALVDATAPNPSVESLLHAFLPYPAVQHSHADVIVTLTNQPDGEALVRTVFGDRVVVLPYVMPGFDLARLCAQRWPEQAHPGVVGMVLLNHGLFTFGEDTRQAYLRHLELITIAEQYLAPHADAGAACAPAPPELPATDPVTMATLRRSVSAAAGFPMVLTRHTDERVRRFLARGDLADVTQRGTATPDHVIHTKRVPLLGTDVARYAEEYRRYYEEHQSRGRVPLTMLDPAPRVILDTELGMITIGRGGKASDIVDDIYRHTMDVVEQAERIGRYTVPPAGDLFDVEYWDLEQAKLRQAGPPPALAGQVAVVTGAASGIGRACAKALLAAGASVVGWDISDSIGTTFIGPQWLGLRADVTDASAVANALREATHRFGGVDIVVAAAGIFPSSARIAELGLTEWRRAMAVNVDSVVELFGQVHPLLLRSPAGGRVVVIGSKNVPAPGPGAAAYSASKAALNQLVRVAALEWAQDGIRVNTVHPDAVFDTGLWTEDMLAARAERYGLSVAEYKRRNLLKTEVTSAGVARLVLAMATDVFAFTTGAQVPVDGGNDRVI